MDQQNRMIFVGSILSHYLFIILFSISVLMNFGKWLWSSLGNFSWRPRLNDADYITNVSAIQLSVPECSQNQPNTSSAMDYNILNIFDSKMSKREKRALNVDEYCIKQNVQEVQRKKNQIISDLIPRSSEVKHEKPDLLSSPKSDNFSQGNSRCNEKEKYILRLNTPKIDRDANYCYESNETNELKNEPGVIAAVPNQQYNSIQQSNTYSRSRALVVSEKYNDEHKETRRQLTLDVRYKKELLNKKKDNEKYKQHLLLRKKLPSYEMKNEILEIIWNNQVTLIRGETGCGKTTQIPQYILDKCILEENGTSTKIMCTQPRRISTIGVSERVAEERGEKCGESSVGYQIRLEKCLPRAEASITFCTTGVILKQLEKDPELKHISHIILDEIHEQNILCDLLITILKQLIKRRKDLKVILMSATFNSDKFASYFNDRCGIITIPGFTFRVEELYLEDILMNFEHSFKPYGRQYGNEAVKKEEEFSKYIVPYIRSLELNRKCTPAVGNELRNLNSEELDFELMKKIIVEITRMDSGAILVFLPGYMDIRKLLKLLRDDPKKFPKEKFLLIPLHSKIPTHKQKTIFNEPPKGKRKIVISTNIAETSITINDVVYVIDCGKIKIKNYDPTKNLDSLTSEWVSLANANQRRGRAGRVKEGVCYRLYTKARRDILEEQQKPEILRERLESVILQIKILNLGKAALYLNNVIDKPPRETIEKAVTILRNMNALDIHEELTPLGFHLAKLPMSPKMGKMVLLGALFSCLDPILSIAASLDFKDPFQCPLGEEDELLRKRRSLCPDQYSDHVVLCEAMKRYVLAYEKGKGDEFCEEYYLTRTILDQLYEMKNELAQYLYDMEFISVNNYEDKVLNVNSDNKALIKAIIAASLYPNIAIVRGMHPRKQDIVTVEGEQVIIVKSSVNNNEMSLPSQYLIYYTKMESGKKIWLHDTTAVHPLSFMFFANNVEISASYIGSSGIKLPSTVPVDVSCSRNQAIKIESLREDFEKVLRNTVDCPGSVCWKNNNEEIQILQEIVILIASNDF